MLKTCKKNSSHSKKTIHCFITICAKINQNSEKIAPKMQEKKHQKEKRKKKEIFKKMIFKTSTNSWKYSWKNKEEEHKFQKIVFQKLKRKIVEFLVNIHRIFNKYSSQSKKPVELIK